MWWRSDLPVMVRGSLLARSLFAGLLGGVVAVAMDMDHLFPGWERRTHWLVVAVLAAAFAASRVSEPRRRGLDSQPLLGLAA